MAEAFFRLRAWLRVTCMLVVALQLALESSTTTAASIRARGNEDSSESSSGGEGASGTSPLCASSCVADCTSKWYILKSCYDTKWGCFQGCTSGCQGKVACRSMCNSQLDWLRCTRESCKLGCEIGSSMSSRFPLEGDDLPGPKPSAESASMAGAENSGQSSGSGEQGAEPSAGDGNAEADLSSDVPYRRATTM